MKVIERKFFEVLYVVPETAAEKEDAHKIIREVTEGSFPKDLQTWKKIDNRKQV